MKKQILDALKAKFPGVSENVLSRIADKLAKTATTEEAVATAIEGVTFQQVLESYGDSRATEATQTAVSNYEKKHGLKDGAKVTGGAPETKEDEPETDDDKSTPAWAKALIDSNKKLTERLNSIEGEKISSTRKQKLDAIIGKLPENLRKSYARTPVKDLSDEDFETLTTEISAEVEELVKNNTAKGAVFGRPVGGGQQSKATAKEATDEEADSVVDRFNLG